MLVLLCFELKSSRKQNGTRWLRCSSRKQRASRPDFGNRVDQENAASVMVTMLRTKLSFFCFLSFRKCMSRVGELRIASLPWFHFLVAITGRTRKQRARLVVNCCQGAEGKQERRSFLSLEEAGLVEMSGLSTHERFLCRLTVSHSLFVLETQLYSFLYAAFIYSWVGFGSFMKT